MSKTKLVVAAVVFVLFMMVLAAINKIGGNWVTQLVEAILGGWIAFPVTTLPKMSADWPSVIFGIGAVVLFPIGIHFLARRWLPWKSRWTVALAAVVVLLFTAGITVIGFTHQIGWLCSSEKPLLVPGPATPLTWKGFWTNNLKRTTLAAHSYHYQFKKLPVGGSFTQDGRMLHSWETQLLPYMPYDTSKIDMTIAWNDPRNAENFHGVILEFINHGLSWQNLHDSDGFGVSHMAANSWVLSANKTMTLSEITDGTSTTILLGGINANFPAWGHPINWRDPSIGINTSPYGFGGPPGSPGVHFAMADGSVRFVSNQISPEVLRALSTPRGGEKILESDLDK